MRCPAFENIAVKTAAATIDIVYHRRAVGAVGADVDLGAGIGADTCIVRCVALHLACDVVAAIDGVEVVAVAHGDTRAAAHVGHTTSAADIALHEGTTMVLRGSEADRRWCIQLVVATDGDKLEGVCRLLGKAAHIAARLAASGSGYLIVSVLDLVCGIAAAVVGPGQPHTVRGDRRRSKTCGDSARSVFRDGDIIDIHYILDAILLKGQGYVSASGRDKAYIMLPLAACHRDDIPFVV